MKVRGRLSFGLILASILAFAGCLVTHDEVARVTSPDGRIDAVTVEGNGGATTSFSYDVYVVQRGWFHRRVHVAHLYGAIRSEMAYGVNVRWHDPSSLAVEYLDAKDADLLQAHPEVSGQLISVQLQPGVSDPSAPSGGMLYNLGK